MKVIASLTTLPGREASCRKTVRTLLQQTPSISQVRVMIPLTYMRLTQTYASEAIQALEAMSPRVKVFRVPKDYGPGLKFFGFAKKGYTFVCDDDQHYHSKTLRRLLRKARGKKKPCVIQNSSNKAIRGFRGILFSPKVLNGFQGFLDKVPKQTWEIDDDLMEVYLRRRNIPILNPAKAIAPRRRFKKTAPAHALGRGNRARRLRQRRILKRFIRTKLRSVNE